MVSNPPIQNLAEKLIIARGLDYQIARDALMSYMISVDDNYFEKQVQRITNPDVFRYLYSVGLSAHRQRLCKEQWEKLTK